MSTTQQESPKIIEQECDQDSYSQPLNLTITSQSSFEEFELIKQEQSKKIESLKSLLLKAKQSLQNFRNENNNQKQEIIDLKCKNQKMEDLMKKYFNDGEEISQKTDNQGEENQIQNNNNIIDKKQQNKQWQQQQFFLKNVEVLEIQANLILNGIQWLCIKFDDYSIQWIREEYFNQYFKSNLNKSIENQENQNEQNIQQKVISYQYPFKLDYNKQVENVKQQQESKQNYEKDLQSVIHQYEERITKFNNVQLDLEEQINKLSEINQQLNEKLKLNKQQLAQLSITLIDESESIRENCLQFMAEENQDDDKKAEETQEIRFLLQKLQKMNIQNDLEPLINLKDHIIILQQTIFDILKKQKINNEDQQIQQKKLQDIIMKMKAQIVKEGKEKQEILVQGRNKIKELEKQFEKYKSESILQFKEKDVKIEFLNKEMKKNIDTQYLKNILIKFFLAEKKVKQRLLPCIGTVLQFSDEELKQIQEQLFPKEQMTFLNSIFTFGGNN